MVANFAVGYDNVDLEACRERGVTFTNTPDVLTNATAELAVALMMAAARRLGEAERMLRAGRLARLGSGPAPRPRAGRVPDRDRRLGRIGQRVAELLSGFGVELAATGRARAGPRAEERSALEYLELDDLLRALGRRHAPRAALTGETRHMIDAAALERFKPGAILVNTARGGLVDTRRARRARFASGRLGGAGLDVFENEPEVPAELLELENAVAGARTSARRPRARATRWRALAARNVVAVLEGGEPLTPVVRGTR